MMEIGILIISDGGMIMGFCQGRKPHLQIDRSTLSLFDNFIIIIIIMIFFLETFSVHLECGRVQTYFTFLGTCIFTIGAKIKIDRDGENLSSTLRKCLITGTSDQIASAKGLLDEKIAEDKEIWARRGDTGMQRNRRAPRTLETALGQFCDIFTTFVMIFYLIIYLFIQVLFSLNVNKCTNPSYKIVGKIYFI